MSQLLVVVDMQNDFITGSLGTKEAEGILDKVVEKIEKYKKEGHRVFYTRDTHEVGYLNTREGKNLPIKHCIRETWGWHLAESIQKTVMNTSQIYDKETFGSLALGEKIKELSKEKSHLEVEIVGLCTDICVVSNALLFKAYVPEILITVDAACCAGVTPESHAMALETMKMCQINVINH